MASSECYLCIATLKPGAALNSFTCNAGDPLGSCHFCGVFVCGHHALRNTNPKEWECGVCVPSCIAPPPGRGGGGPTPPPTGGSPRSGQPVTSTYGVTPYSEGEFVEVYPLSSDALRGQIRDAVADPDAVFKSYYGEGYQKRLVDEFKDEISFDERSQLVIPLPLATRLAAALAFISFCQIPDELLASHLRRDVEKALAEMEAC